MSNPSIYFGSPCYKAKDLPFGWKKKTDINGIKGLKIKFYTQIPLLANGNMMSAIINTYCDKQWKVKHRDRR